MGTTKHPAYMPMWTTVHTDPLSTLSQRWIHSSKTYENCDTFATLLDEVCHDVEIEPKLQSLEGESFHNKTTTNEDGARLDITANGLWGGRFSRTFFDVKIFKTNAKSCPKTISDAYKYHECQNNKIPTKNSGCRLQQLCSTIFCLYRRSSSRLYKNQPEN